MADTAVVVEYPRCDFCRGLNAALSPARYDFKTSTGQWANGCQYHYELNRMYPDLGTGKGQLLVK